MLSQHALQVVSQHALQQGVPVPGGSAPGGGAARGGSAPGGACSGGRVLRPPTHRKQTATVADGTHPTGMHSCLII